ncbi:MAG: ATP-binding protein [Chitinophagales bacterium]|nr:ATP-binding protein [Chitinophagales bacterium]
MLQITPEFREEIIQAIFANRESFSGSDAKYAKSLGFDGTIYSRLKGGEREKLLGEEKYIDIAMKLNVEPQTRKWKTVRTKVFDVIEEQIRFCQTNSKSMMLVDDTGIGKTYTAKYLSRQLQNCFYIDCSQAKGMTEFIRHMARTCGVEDKGRLTDIKNRIKYTLKVLPTPIVILDEAGDLSDRTFLEVKEIWNATEGQAGWYMMGAEGLQNKVQRNINNRKPGFAEIFSRFGERYGAITPQNHKERIEFYTELIRDVLSANMQDKSKLSSIVNKCLSNDAGKISGLRRAESLLLLNSDN